ncbi:hypothetical protein ABW19_dt0209419 [Dactylella cylindrospora]|nr:hypothetical protein ABW19_dt0209419 [Dactylella cylindrospora]
MGKSTFDPTSPNNQRYLLRVLRHMDIKAVDIEAVAQEEGITKAAAMKKLKGIRDALEERLNMSNSESSSGTSTASQPSTPQPKRAKDISTPTPKRRKIKAEDWSFD